MTQCGSPCRLSRVSTPRTIHTRQVISRKAPVQTRKRGLGQPAIEDSLNHIFQYTYYLKADYPPQHCLEKVLADKNGFAQPTSLAREDM